MEHYAVKSDQRHSLEKIENLILFEARGTRGITPGKFIVAGASSQIVGRVTRRFRRRAVRPKCGRPGRHGNKQLLKALLRARHTHALAGVECRTHP